MPTMPHFRRSNSRAAHSQSRSLRTRRVAILIQRYLIVASFQCLPGFGSILVLYSPLWASGECDYHFLTPSPGLRPYDASCFMGPTAVGESDEVTAMVETALRLGYRHIDTVHMHFAHVTETSD